MDKMSKQPTINKHGLKRRVEPDIKREIRKQDGYGCIVCGSMLVDYEHIDPLFCDAKEHDPSKMALLCGQHHDPVTRRIMPKRLIKKHKEDPYCKKHGYAFSTYFPNPDDIKIKCGNSYFQDTKKIFEINGRPIIWIEKEDDEILFSAIFFDDIGRKIGYLNKNTFIALVNDCDIFAIGTRIEARTKKGTINLELNIEGDGIVELRRLSAKYFGTNIKINKSGDIKIDSNTFSNIQTFNCGGAFRIGSIPRVRTSFYKLKPIQKSLIKERLPRIKNLNGFLKGYIYQDQIIDQNNFVTAYIQGEKVYTIQHEYIGDIFKTLEKNTYTIGTNEDEYEDREPIYIEEKNRQISKIIQKPTIETLYRIFN